ncbi:hypothetical protein GCM10025857_23530 [Alicyclobacillus contaminans]|uniref:hypothetical protein n=1 Tax=Alicyclobacillus contaminans TaxID=392016 RepID=UPI00041AD8BB|nr:hypothetical protein [Alicyclobacillus contaminans]GMA50996.1 hypothetical protein GCM10025857_23530 [Alicyclobacillus contaminans]
MKRTLTGIAAASMVLGAFAPAAFAATSTSYKVAGQLPIIVNGSVLSNPYELTAQDSGNTTGFFPVYYFNQALNKIGFTATWNGTTRTWAINAPGVDASKISIPGGVGTGNTTITVNGTVVKKINTFAAKDPAGGKNAQATTYFPAYYIDEVFNQLGATVSFDGTKGLTITGGTSTSTGAGSISAPSFTGQKVGTGAQATPAISFGDPVTVSATLTDPNGNPLVGVNALLDVVYYGGGAPTVKDANGNILSATNVTTSDGAAFQYKVPTNSAGVASAQISVGANLSASYMIRFEAPYNIAGTTSTLKSSKGYLSFVPANKLGITPLATSTNPFEATVSSGSDSTAGVVPVTVVIPPNSATAQAGVPVTFHFVNAGPAFFSSANGGSIGTNDQTVYTDSNGVATVYVDAASLGDATIEASATNYSSVQTTIHWSQAGIVNKLDNKTASGYQTSPSTDVYNANLGDNVTFQATAEDENGNPVANAQLLIANSELNGDVNHPLNSAHGGYVDSNGNTTDFPNVSVLNLSGSTNPSTLGEVVTTDASGNFSFTVNDYKLYSDGYYVYSIQGGVVQDLLWATQVNWQSGTNLNYIGIAGAAGEIKYDSNSVTGLTGQASLTYTPTNVTVVRFAGFVGKEAPLGDGLNQTYTLSTTGEQDAAIWGVHVDSKASGVPASDYVQDPDGGYWYQLNPGQRGVGSITLRVAQESSGSNLFDVYVNGTLIGTNTQTGWDNTSNGGDGEYQGTVKLAMADDDNGSATLTVSSSGKTATAQINFNGGLPFETEQVTPQIVLTNGQSQDLSFTLEDDNGNPIANTLGAIQFADSPDLWVTKINGVALTMNQSGGSLGTGSAAEPTPIPLWDTTNASEQPLTNGKLGYNSVNVAGVGSWSPNGSTNTVYAYSDSNGKITLTLQDGAVSYWSNDAIAGGGSVVSAPNATGSVITEKMWSPVGNETNIEADSSAPKAQLVIRQANPGSGAAAWTQVGVITFVGP